jgi:hypothetical protein
MDPFFINSDDPMQKACTISPQWESKSEHLSITAPSTMPHHFQSIKEALSGTWKGPRPMKELVLWCVNGA